MCSLVFYIQETKLYDWVQNASEFIPKTQSSAPQLILHRRDIIGTIPLILESLCGLTDREMGRGSVQICLIILSDNKNVQGHQHKIRNQIHVL